MPNESQLPAGDATQTAPSASQVGPGYEVRDTNVRGIAVFIVGLFVMLAVVQVGLWGLLRGISGAPEPQTPREAPDVITDQRRRLETGEREALDGKGAPGRMSIDQAIEIVADRGLPARGGRARTEVDVNSHSGIRDQGKRPGAKDQGKAGRDQRSLKDRGQSKSGRGGTR